MNHCKRLVTLKLSQSILLTRNAVPAQRNSLVFNPALVKSHENCPSLVKLSQQYYSTENAKDDLTKKFDTMVKESQVVVFMKGVPSQPMCGFSNAVVQVLRMHGVEYKAHNVLEDETIRQGIKEYSSWPTIPQVYVGGNFVGGCDILLQMHRSGELIEELEKCGIRSALLDESEKTPPEKKE